MKNLQGLTEEEVLKSAEMYGKNTLTVKERKSFFRMYAENYNDPIIIVLLVALSINVLFTLVGKVDWHECAGILLSVMISTFVSAISEYSNENAFMHLQEQALLTKCKVWRNSRLCEVEVSEIVVGDQVLLQSGDLIPADGRIVDGRIKVDQSPLNGESAEVEKSFDRSITTKSKVDDFWNTYSLFRGSVVCSGEAVMIVDEVGDNTVYGKLTAESQTDGRESPLAVKLAALAKSISKFGCISAIIIVILSFANNAFFANNFDPMLIENYFSDISLVVSDFVNSIIVGIIVIVVAVPDGLPLMIAIVCSLNMKKMLKANVLVRKLIGIETAGGINILFTDKTGTITAGRLKVVKFFDGAGVEYGSLFEMGDKLKEYVRIGIAANSSARFSENKIIGGNATEKALLEFIGRHNSEIRGMQTLMNVPFSSENKYSMTCVKKDEKITLIKGAPEIILPKCSCCIDGNAEQRISSDVEKKMKKAAEEAMRLIAVALCRGEVQDGKIPDNMMLIGVAAIRDDVRPEAKRAVEEVRGAGIQVVMITGDRLETAVAIAKESGIADKDGVVLTSKQLAEMNDNDVMKILPKLRVVARALPTDKSRLVRLAQGMNLVVGMTGDGVNDAPALKLADVGFAMGGGAEAATASADVVLLDDNFRSIKNAVLYGRTIYNSIRKFVKYQLTINIAAVGVSMIGPIVGIEKPLDISQMVWTNLLIDSLAAIAFGGEPALKRYMNEKPRKRDENIINANMWSGIAVCGLYICAMSLLFFTSPVIREAFRPANNDIYFYTGYFCFFIFVSVFNAFNVRCEGIDLLENLSLNKQFISVMSGVAIVQIIMTNFGGNMLRCAPLNLREWVAVIVPALTVFPLDIGRKIIMGNR